MGNGKNVRGAERLNLLTIISSLKIALVKMDCILYVRNAAIRKRDKVMGEIYKIITDFNNKIYIGKAKNGAESR